MNSSWIARFLFSAFFTLCSLSSIMAAEPEFFVAKALGDAIADVDAAGMPSGVEIQDKDLKDIELEILSSRIWMEDVISTQQVADHGLALAQSGNAGHQTLAAVTSSGKEAVYFFWSDGSSKVMVVLTIGAIRVAVRDPSRVSTQDSALQYNEFRRVLLRYFKHSDLFLEYFEPQTSSVSGNIARISYRSITSKAQSLRDLIKTTRRARLNSPEASETSPMDFGFSLDFLRRVRGASDGQSTVLYFPKSSFIPVESKDGPLLFGLKSPPPSPAPSTAPEADPFVPK